MAANAETIVVSRCQACTGNCKLDNGAREVAHYGDPSAVNEFGVPDTKGISAIQTGKTIDVYCPGGGKAQVKLP